MTKKDYVALAGIINKALLRHGNHKAISCLRVFVDDLIDDFSTHFKRDNSAFNKARFKAACLEIGGSDALQGL